MKKFTLYFLSILLISHTALGEKKEKVKKDSLLNSSLVSGLKFRSIGPAWASGRIADFAVNPKNLSEYYVGVASGNVWKTTNNGTTWKPIFDNYGAYSIGVVELDPNNPNTVWVGTGENNHQRALGYGDGVYKSLDGGQSFKNMGLKDSRQIGGIVIHPEDPNTVFVAAEGSVWAPGGDRGLYKTTDGGESWEKILEISENTGVNNIVMDPTNPDILYATSEQRRRTSIARIGGGPESAVYKSTDGGENWRKIMKGLPHGDIGGMGIAISPVDPFVVYLIVEAKAGSGGFYRSVNKGESWKKMSSYHASGQYYNEIFCDPVNVDKIFSTETISKYSVDGGKTWKRIGNSGRHVDDHALWIDPTDTNHFLIGGDGGIYETWDHGKTYDFKENLPITQFYRVHVDNDKPFYNVYGGTQDNNSMGGPSRNISNGVTNDEWYSTLGGDGFWVATDPTNPDIVYTEYQYGNIYRYDKKSKERINIKPRPRKGEKTYKWNWNAPFIISPFNSDRLYMGANKLFRSDDNGNSWTVISDDLTAQVDRHSIKIMDQYWPVDAVAKDVSTSLWGTIVALDESPVKEGLIYVGTDDGVISVTEDGGNSWRQIKSISGVPQYTYVSSLFADKFDENVVYATFDNLKRDDFTPYVYKSTDKGRTWKSIANNLPKNGTVHDIVQDHKKADLLFVGTEFGIHFSYNGGKNWIQLKSGLPTIPVKDIAIQEREDDLALATFGRGFYILDDYSPLRIVSKELANVESEILPIKDALLYATTYNKGNQGSTYYVAKNPQFGANIPYYIKEIPKSAKQLRKKRERELKKEGKYIPQPSLRDLALEKNQEKSHLIFNIYDSNDNIITKITKSPSKGIKRVNWNLRYDMPSSVNSKSSFNPTKSRNYGLLVMPGEYKVDMHLWHEGTLTQLSEPVAFNVKRLNNTTLPAENYKENVDFAKEVSELSVAMIGTNNLINELKGKVEDIKRAIYKAPKGTQDMMDRARDVAKNLDELEFTMNGSEAVASWEEIPPSDMPLMRRLRLIGYTHMNSTSEITGTEKESLEILKDEFPPVLNQLNRIVNGEIPQLEKELNEIGAPWTSGRVPVWK